jgi:hydrogenase maturation protease
MSRPPLLVFGYGNPSRGDDALGPVFLERLEDQRAHEEPSSWETLTDFQLQIEHALDLEDRTLVLFVDASFSANAPFTLTRLSPSQDDSYTTHAMSPSSVLAVFEQVSDNDLPPVYLLSIRGYEFELGATISEQAEQNLNQAVEFVLRLLHSKDLRAWQQAITAA